jgi:hypothetical protein
MPRANGCSPIFRNSNKNDLTEIQPFSGDKYSLELLVGGGMSREDFQRIVDSIARAIRALSQ